MWVSLKRAPRDTREVLEFQGNTSPVSKPGKLNPNPSQDLPRPSNVVPFLVVLMRVLTKKNIPKPKMELQWRDQVGV